MKTPPLFEPIVDALRGEQLKPTIILLATPLLLITWRWAGSPEFYLEHLASRFALWGDYQATAAAYSFLACFLLMGLIPALLVKCVFGERLADYGVRIGNVRRTLQSMAIWVPVMLLAGFSAARDPDIAAYYPINGSASSSAAMFAFHAMTYVAFYLGWEFYFRGFMQAGLRPSMGPANALLVQVAISAILHLGKPTTEIYISIAAAVLWGLLAYRTRSIVSGTVQHAVVGISLDWFLCRPPV